VFKIYPWKKTFNPILCAVVPLKFITFLSSKLDKKTIIIETAKTLF